MGKIGRNDPCRCGSGKKYKKCCLLKQGEQGGEFLWYKLRKTEGQLTEKLLKYAHKRYGEDSILEAWDEFTIWEGVPFEPETNPEFGNAFLTWFLYNWIPDNEDRDPLNFCRPEAPVAITYLKENPDKLDDFQKRFISFLAGQPFSFFVVTDVVPHRSITVKDIILSQTYTVKEKTGSLRNIKGSIIFARVLSIDDVSILVGCMPVAIPPSYHYYFIDFREDWLKKIGKLTPQLLDEFSAELRDLYYDIEYEIKNPGLPELRNTDGDPLVFTVVYYDLRCSPQYAFDRLKKLALDMSDDQLLDEAVFSKEGALEEVSFPWLKKGNKMHKTWDNTAMGQITIKRTSLTIEVNSIKRAEKIKAEINKRLPTEAVYKNAVSQSAEKSLKTSRGKGKGISDSKIKEEQEMLLADPQIKARLKEMAEGFWENWLDKKIPALGNKTPREATQNRIDREKLEALFLEYEARSHNSPNNLCVPDIPALKKALGLNNERSQ